MKASCNDGFISHCISCNGFISVVVFAGNSSLIASQSSAGHVTWRWRSAVTSWPMALTGCWLLRCRARVLLDHLCVGRCDVAHPHPRVSFNVKHWSYLCWGYWWRDWGCKKYILVGWVEWHRSSIERMRRCRSTKLHASIRHNKSVTSSQ